MSNPVIEVIVSPTGGIALHTKGFFGSACRDASKALERALGPVQSDSPTAEMYQSQTANQPLQQS